VESKRGLEVLLRGALYASGPSCEQQWNSTRKQPQNNI